MSNRRKSAVSRVYGSMQVLRQKSRIKTNSLYSCLCLKCGKHSNCYFSNLIRNKKKRKAAGCRECWKSVHGRSNTVIYHIHNRLKQQDLLDDCFLDFNEFWDFAKSNCQPDLWDDGNLAANVKLVRHKHNFKHSPINSYFKLVSNEESSRTDVCEEPKNGGIK